MKTRSLGKVMAIAATAVTMGALPATAQINYTTTGTFQGGAGCNTNTCTIGGITIVFNGATGVNVIAPSNIGLGTFDTNGPPGSSGNFNVPFVITVNQTTPSGGSGSFPAGQLEGNVMVTSSGSSTDAIFTPVEGSEVQIGLVVYEFAQEEYFLVPPTVVNGVAGPGTTTIQGVVSVIPEPSSVLLMASGLAGLGLFGLRARRRSSSEN